MNFEPCIFLDEACSVEDSSGTKSFRQAIMIPSIIRTRSDSSHLGQLKASFILIFRRHVKLIIGKSEVMIAKPKSIVTNDRIQMGTVS